MSFCTQFLRSSYRIIVSSPFFATLIFPTPPLLPHPPKGPEPLSSRGEDGNNGVYSFPSVSSSFVVLLVPVQLFVFVYVSVYPWLVSTKRPNTAEEVDGELGSVPYSISWAVNRGKPFSKQISIHIHFVGENVLLCEFFSRLMWSFSSGYNPPQPSQHPSRGWMVERILF